MNKTAKISMRRSDKHRKFELGHKKYVGIKKYVDDFRGMYLSHVGFLEAGCELWNYCRPQAKWKFLPPLRKPKAFWESSFSPVYSPQHRGASALTSSRGLLSPAACLGTDHRLSGLIFVNTSDANISCFLRQA